MIHKITQNKILILGALFICHFMIAQNSPSANYPSKAKNNKKETNKKVPTLVAEYDFQAGTYKTNKLNPKHNQPIVLKVTNINRLANQVFFSTNDVKIQLNEDNNQRYVEKIIKENKITEPITTASINTEVSAPKDAEFKESTDNKMDPQEKMKLYGDIKIFEDNKTDQENALIITSNTVLEKKQAVNIAKKDYDEAVNKLNQISEVEKLAANTIDELQTDIKNKEIVLNTAKSELTKEELNKEMILKKLERIDFQINSLHNKLEIYGNILKNFTSKTNLILEKFDNIQINIMNINRINAAYNSYINYIINPNLTRTQYKNEVAGICVVLDKEKTNDYQLYIKEYEKSFREFLSQYNTTFNGDLFFEIAKVNKSYADLVKLKFDNVKKEAESINVQVNPNELRKKLNDVEIIDSFLSTENAFTTFSDVIQPLEDFVEINVQINQKSELGTSIIKQNPKEFTYREYVRRGVRWDFSAGSVFDFGIANQEYEVRENPANATNARPTYNIIQNNSSLYTPTIAGLMHTSFRSSSMFALGFSLGLSIDLTSFNLNSFFPGVSLLVGKKEKTIFTIGPALKKVKQIKAIYDTTSSYSTPISVSDITSDQYRLGWFVGISYNLTNSQKSKIKLAN